MKAMINIFLDLNSISHTTPCLNAFVVGQAVAYKMFETINRKPDIDIYNINGLVHEDIQGDIELKDVYFSYPTWVDVGKINPWALNFRCQNCSIRFIWLMDFKFDG